jgi:DNA primase
MRTFVARSWLKDVRKKVLMPAGSQAERALFGYDTLLNERRHWQDLILVEGVFGAMRMWRAGYRETVATLGAHVTELQRNLVKRLKPRYVVLLRDADEAGRDAEIKEAKALSEAMLNVKIAHLPNGTDIDLATDTNILDAIQSARPVTHQLGIEAMKEEHQL